MSREVSIFPASFAQRRLWFLQRMNPAGTAYNIMFWADFPAGLNVEAMRRALGALVMRHESLRTGFRARDGELVQAIRREGELQVRLEDLREMPGDAQAAFMERVAADVAEPFDLAAPPLSRVRIGLLQGGRARLALVVHHVVADGRSAEILMEDLERAYAAQLEGGAARGQEPEMQYAEYAVWQRQRLTGQRLDALLGYWKNRIGPLPELELRHDRPRRSDGSGRGELYRFSLGPEIVGRVQAVAARSRSTLFGALLGAFCVVLGRFSGQTSFPIGIPVSGRTRPQLERVVGLFINSVVFGADLSGDPTFEELVARVGRSLAEDLTHQELPFELLVDHLNIRRRAGRNPLFQVMFQLQQERGVSAPPAGPPASDAAVGSDSPGEAALTSQLDLSIIQYTTPDGGVAGGAVYASDLFDRSTIEQLVEGYINALTHASIQPAVRISELRLVSEQKQLEIMALGTGEHREWHGATCLQEWLAEQAARTPTAVAASLSGEEVTFRELDNLAGTAASRLRAAGAGPGSTVAVCMERSIDLLVGVLGVLKAGAAFLAIDPRAPRHHIEFIIEDSNAVCVAIADGFDAGWINKTVVELPVDRHAACGDGTTVACRPDDPAYVIYTSGSTGCPKGVVIPHRAIVNHMRWMLERFPLDEGDRVLQRTPMTFDASVWEVLAPLLSGACLVLMPGSRLFDPVGLIDLIRGSGVTTLQVVPSLLRALLWQGGLENCGALRRVFCGGEVLTPELRDAYFAKCGAQLVNLYGPTEATIDATYHVVARDDRREFVPVGRPIANVSSRVLNDGLALAPLGVEGELFLGGEGLAIGYLGREELTAERFIADPFGEGRLYRTGDRARMHAGGELEYVGRRDHQVKLRGFRIELGEIEAALLAHTSVREAAVVVQDYGAGDQRLTAFVTAQPPDDGLRAELAEWVRARLPEYEVPAAVVVRAELPHTLSGKVDRAALAAERSAGTGTGIGGAPPRTETQRQVCRLFAEILHADQVFIDDDFFQMGGHSLLVITLVERLNAALRSGLRIVDLFEHPSPRQLAAVIDSSRNGHGAMVKVVFPGLGAPSPVS